ncbi:EAL domain-containing protein [Pseudomonas sp. GD04087]|uniref:sensor domain-containing protein n=1 Tax=unclassified Pseudomonas TaxID=196821 RepID=UPI0024493EDB|nr:MULTISPECIES: EAL domain-containing protein [unclassified Pseudomonas]MDH0288644.1 EAL domain-containing protein [Pseudomonas sp. GD04087]MDH1049857.1 EAL domain-containing protein [Pseudomonas sp. GD03903]MDH1998124.1 EAL domain-containing protein [Pseudomonas sp. GD03691]
MTFSDNTHAGWSLAQLEALNRSKAIARFTPDGTLLYANQNYRRLLGYETEEIRGRHHSFFCSQALVRSPTYGRLWQRLNAGQSCSEMAERIRSDGRRCWLSATYMPVFDDSGEVELILKIATEVTDDRQPAGLQQRRLDHLAVAAECSDTAVLISDSDAHIAYTNGGFQRMLGWTEDEARGRNLLEVLSPQLDARRIARLEADLQRGLPMQLEELIQGKQGQRYWVKIVSNPILDDQGRLQHSMTLLTDITRIRIHETLQQKALEAMAREKPLAKVLELICLEVERIAPEVSASILQVDEHDQLHPLAAPSLPEAYSRQLDGLKIGPRVGSCGTAAWRNEAVKVDNIAADPLWADFLHLALPVGILGCWSAPIRNAQGRPIGTFAFYFRQPRNTHTELFHQRLADACTHLCALALERESTQRRIRQLAFYDSLTGMPNRSLLQANAGQSIAAAARDGEQLAALFIDLDRFKQVNDSFGHPMGDELLREVATRIQQELRPVDLAGRLSGDELVVILPGCDAEQATPVVERIQARINQPIALGNTNLSISASIGIALYPSDGQDFDTLIRCADMAMYQAKSGGRGRFSFFSAELNKLAQERLALEIALRDALHQNQLRLHYQPQIELGSKRMYGVEALARWTHPQLGEIPPTRFIPLAEECGLIAELGRWALSAACRQLSEWRAKGLPVPVVAVNLSPVSFHNLDLPNLIEDALSSNDLTAQDLTLELTENILLDTTPTTLQTIHEIHAQGVKLSMDDFGTGYSSLSYLRRLPISELKLDRSFVADIELEEEARALSNAILGIGKSLHMTVVAEGVENDSQSTLLQEQGYPVAQGYLFSRPLPADELERWIIAWEIQHTENPSGAV